MPRLWRRFFALGRDQRALLARAALTMGLARLGLWVLPLGALRRLLHAGAHSVATRDVASIVWAVSAVGRRLPWSTCLVEALAADRLLRRAGHASEVRIGMRRGTRTLEAHAWVVSNGRIVLGNDHTLDQYTVLSASEATT